MLQNQYVHVNPSEQMFYLTVHTQSLTCIQLFFDPMGCNLPDSSVHGLSQARILEWVAISSSMGILLTWESNPHLPNCR